MKKQIKVLFGILVVSALSACGNVPAKKDTIKSDFSSASDGSIGSANSCKATPNVTSQLTWMVNNINTQFRACSVPTSLGTMQVFPEDKVARELCFFPARLQGSQPLMFIANPNIPPQNASQGRYASACKVVASQGSYVDFAGLSYNAVYIVERSQAALFANCAGSGALSYCASSQGLNFSYGTL